MKEYSTLDTIHKLLKQKSDWCESDSDLDFYSNDEGIADVLESCYNLCRKQEKEFLDKLIEIIEEDITED